MQAQSIAVRAELEAPEGCPDADWFLQQILKRAPGARAAVAAEAARRYRASVRRENGGFSGVVESETLARTDGSTAQGSSCEEVVGALAMTVALSLDADPMGPSPAASPAGSEPLVPARAAEPVKPERPEPPERHPVAPPPVPSPWLAGVSIEAAVLGVSFAPLVGGQVGVMLRATQPGPWAPLVLIGGGFFAQPGGGDVALQMPFGLVDLCPSLVELGPLWLTPCAHNVVGWLRGEMKGPRADQPASLLFGASGLQMRFDYVLEPVSIGLRGGVMGVWSAPVFRSQPSGTALLETGRVAVDGGLGLALVF